MDSDYEIVSGDAHLIFNGASRLLKFFLVTDHGAELRHTWQCHDVGVNDAIITQGQDEYGHHCKAPPGKKYILGAPQKLEPPEIAYGFYFTPISDDPKHDFANHGRDGIGIHGGGSDLPNPYAPRQGWEYTFGCLRLQNEDNLTFVDSVQYVQKHGGTCYLDIDWP